MLTEVLRTYGAASILLLAVALYSTGGQKLHAQDNVCASRTLDPVAKYDPETEACYRAFCDLPSSDQQGTTPQKAFGDHVRANKEVFLRFNKACFLTWDDLKDYSRAFLNDLYGVLFFKGPNGLILTCSAFRISEDIILTARHCIYEGQLLVPSPADFTFRSMASPNADIAVIGEEPIQPVISKKQIANDFRDYLYLKISSGSIAFRKAKDDFRSSARRGTELLIAGVNRVSFILDADENPGKWQQSFRFTRVAGAQWLPIERLPAPPPSQEAAIRCIYTKAPTFAGMSGAPIIGSDFDPSSGLPPKLFVFGLHIRSGLSVPPYEFDSDCGNYPGFNVGLVLPKEH
jgi:hypothetical protein